MVRWTVTKVTTSKNRARHKRNTKEVGKVAENLELSIDGEVTEDKIETNGDTITLTYEAGGLVSNVILPPHASATLQQYTEYPGKPAILYLEQQQGNETSPIQFCLETIVPGIKPDVAPEVPQDATAKMHNTCSVRLQFPKSTITTRDFTLRVKIDCFGQVAKGTDGPIYADMYHCDTGAIEIFEYEPTGGNENLRHTIATVPEGYTAIVLETPGALVLSEKYKVIFLGKEGTLSLNEIMTQSTNVILAINGIKNVLSP